MQANGLLQIQSLGKMSALQAHNRNVEKRYAADWSSIEVFLNDLPSR